MKFTDSNYAEQMTLDAAPSLGNGEGSSVVRKDKSSFFETHVARRANRGGFDRDNMWG